MVGVILPYVPSHDIQYTNVVFTINMLESFYNLQLHFIAFNCCIYINAMT